ncbi:MAG: type II toxin-antitoxin system HicB family antitoxin [Bacilli bacterium]
MDRYIYPALFELGDVDGYTVTFPDLPGCITEGDSLEEALHMAKKALELHLWGMEDDRDPIPEPSAPGSIPIVEEGAFITLIEAYMPLIRDELANKVIKKTLTIPKWLNDAAESQHINFSHVLQHALKDRLGVAQTLERESK